MKIYALYYKDTFVVAFPYREDCVGYGKKHYEGYEWDCNILERWLYETKQYPLTQPLPFSQPLTTPYTPPIPLKTTPYEPNIWCGPKATLVSDVPHQFTIDHTQTPKTND
jgi:hypothetical protein